MVRTEITEFREIPNVGVAIEKNLLALGLCKPIELVGKDPYQLYEDLCRITNKQHDPCVLDVLISAVRFMEGGPSKRWWEYTKERKKAFKGK